MSTSHPAARKPTVEPLDDDETASSSGETTPIADSSKRKLKDIDVWANEPDNEWERFQENKKPRRVKKRNTTKSKRAVKDSSEQKPSRSLQDFQNALDEDPAKYDDDSIDNIHISGHLVERRKQFDEDRRLLGESGLKIPPNYGDIDFSDDEKDPRELEERPRFNINDVQPCRPYTDIQLESASLIPASIAQYLRDYQIDGVRFLHERFVYQRGAILGDDMGLGKTVQVAAFLTAAFGKTGDERDGKRLRKIRRIQGKWYPRILIVAPGSLIANWKSELMRWGWWRIEVYHGSEREDALKAARTGALEIMITTYATYKNNEERINLVEWDAVIADECHQIKDRRTDITRAMDKVNALCRIGLTGTAIQNKYEEFWTLLNWTNPGQFGTLIEWDRSIVKPLTRGQSHDATWQQLSLARKTAKKFVQNLLPNFFLRRMKSLISHQLPKKSDRVVFCPLTTLQKDAYKNVLDSEGVKAILSSIELCQCGSKKKQGWCCGKTTSDGKPWVSLVFPTIQALQKLSNHLMLLIPSKDETDRERRAAGLKMLKDCVPRHWETLYKQRNSIHTLSNPEFCGKWKILKNLLSFWYENKDKVLVFSHSVRLLEILKSLFRNTSYSVSFLSGQLSYDDRQREVDDFNSDPNKFIFLISTKAGGVGLNITSANKVVIVDPHWNPAYDLQAQDRAYRIGQLRDVEVFRLVSAGTIEEIVYARQIYKQQQANIGYNASSERRYFKGVQQDKGRKGELFGLKNLFSFHSDQVVLQGIMNQTNIAEARVGAQLVDIDMNKVGQDDDDGFKHIKQEDSGEDDGGLSQLAAFIKSENPEELVKKNRSSKPNNNAAIQAILASAGVQYTHENSEVIGSSKVEAQLSRRAEMVEDMDFDDTEGHSALFAESQFDSTLVNDEVAGFTPRFNPPQEVMQRQFCSMAKEFGFDSVTEFALVVEQMTQEERRDALDSFYKKRMAELLMKDVKKNDSVDEKVDMLKFEADAFDMKDVKVQDSVKDRKIEPEASENIARPGDGARLDGSTNEEVKGETKEESTIMGNEGTPTAITGDTTAVRPITSIFIYNDDSDNDEDEL